jgi:hypothetical protein
LKIEQSLDEANPTISPFFLRSATVAQELSKFEQPPPSINNTKNQQVKLVPKDLLLTIEQLQCGLETARIHP